MQPVKGGWGLLETRQNWTQLSHLLQTESITWWKQVPTAVRGSGEGAAAHWGKPTCAFHDHLQVDAFWLVFKLLQLRESGLHTFCDLRPRGKAREREGHRGD